MMAIETKPAFFAVPPALVAEDSWEGERGSAVDSFMGGSIKQRQTWPEVIRRN
jgi:hypothetical protein